MAVCAAAALPLLCCSETTAAGREASSDRERLRLKIRRLTKSRSVSECSKGTAGGDTEGAETPEDPRLTSAVVEGQKRRLGGLTRVKAMRLKRAADRTFKGTKGESDRFIQVKKVKWMMSGKRGLGKTHSR